MQQPMSNRDDLTEDDFLSTLTPESILELGRIFGKIDAIEEAKQAIKDGRAEDWLIENEPKTMDEWDQYEALYGNRVDRIINQIVMSPEFLTAEPAQVLRAGVEAGLRGFYSDDQAD